MASVFGHVAASTAIGFAFFPKQVRPVTLVIAGFCAFAPDLDVLGFRFGIPYASEWGHRGWTHSLLFAVLAGSLIGLLGQWLIRRWNTAKSLEYTADSSLVIWFMLSMVTHPLLDMLTNGGRGVAFWWPFSVERIFFPWRPIQVSPLSMVDFFTPWGLEVLATEVVWIGVPGIVLVWILRLYRSKAS